MDAVQDLVQDAVAADRDDHAWLSGILHAELRRDLRGLPARSRHKDPVGDMKFIEPAPVIFAVGAKPESAWVRPYDQKNFAEIDAEPFAPVI